MDHLALFANFLNLVIFPSLLHSKSSVNISHCTMLLNFVESILVWRDAFSSYRKSFPNEVKVLNSDVINSRPISPVVNEAFFHIILYYLFCFTR